MSGRFNLFRVMASAAFAALAFILFSLKANALEIKCIEASKYKYLFALFDNDPRKFADYLSIGADKLPEPESCRAVIVTGGITLKQETRKLIDAIAANQGWLTTLVLASGGGSVEEGKRLAEIVRFFWLKTVAHTGSNIANYQPDFAPQPLGLYAPQTTKITPPKDTSLLLNWDAYRKEAATHLTLLLPGQKCASSCTMLFTAGIERQGIVLVHRARFSGKNTDFDTNMLMSQYTEGLQASEAAQTALYRQMDAGDEFIRIYQSTPSNIVGEVSGARMPRYVNDNILARCGSDPAQLQDIDTRLRRAINETNARAAPFISTESMQNALATVYARRAFVEACAAKAHERERLSAFARFCERGCARDKINSAVDAKVRELNNAH